MEAEPVTIFDSFNQKKEKVSKVLKRYTQRKKYRKEKLKDATGQSFTDLLSEVHDFGEAKSLSNLLSLGKVMTTSSAWVSHSYIRYLKSNFDFSSSDRVSENAERSKRIVDKFVDGENLDDEKDEDIFKAFYHELEYQHKHPNLPRKLECPKTNSTMVLISGVLNEIFSTPAFERGASHISRNCGMKYISADVAGTKSSEYNAELIFEQLTKYVLINPDKKLWLVCFSKGGVDALHFLNKYPDFSSKYICGLSTIATPILGTDHLNNKFLKWVNEKLEHCSESELYKLIYEKRDVLARELQKNLSTTYQIPWFKKNHMNLPKNIFYTSLSLQSYWYESHIWMILTKLLLQSNNTNDGVVETRYAHFPNYFKSINFGTIRGHHLIGTRSSFHNQEALLEAHVLYLKYLGHL